MMVKTTPFIDTQSSVNYRAQVAMLEEFLVWMNIQGYAVSQWQACQDGEYLVNVTEQAVQALPVMFANERDNYAPERARTGEAAAVKP